MDQYERNAALYKTRTSGNSVLTAPMAKALKEGRICVQHPALSLATEALSHYERWVSAEVMPIAFQWIYENHKKVYDRIERKLWDDVGVVIRTAFDLVKEMEAYKESQKELAKLESEMTVDPMTVNPIWRAIWEKLEKEMRDAFKDEPGVPKKDARDVVHAV